MKSAKFIYKKGFFQEKNSREEIIKAIKEEGFNPILISDKPNFIYEIHQHPEAKLIVCLKGSMQVKVQGEEFTFQPGDKLLIPGNTLHSAVVGKNGCVFYWSEKIL